MGTFILLVVGAWIIYAIFFSDGKDSSRNKSPDLAVPKCPSPVLSPRLETRCHLAGAPHYIGGKSAANFSIFAVGQSLTPIREPDNPYDGRAIALYLHGRKVGHIPRAKNTDHAMHIDAGGCISVMITAVDPSEPWEGVKITVTNL